MISLVEHHTMECDWRGGEGLVDDSVYMDVLLGESGRKEST